jgi:two-component system LytT family response regulator
MPATVFVTAYDAYALQAFAVSAVDYLLKPFDDARFDQAFARARDRVRARRQGQLDARLEKLWSFLREHHPQKPTGTDGEWAVRLSVQARDHIYLVEVDDIDWIEAEGVYVRLHCDSRTHLLRDSLKHLATVLDPARFVRVHRSAIVNIDRIEALYPRSHGEYDLRLRSGAHVRLSRSYRQALARILP